MCEYEKENTTRDLVRVLRFSRTLAMERHHGVCKTWGAFISVAHITESSSRRKSLQTTKMYRGKIIWKRRYVVFELIFSLFHVSIMPLKIQECYSKINARVQTRLRYKLKHQRSNYRYESDLKTRHDEEIQQTYLKRKRTTKRTGRILFVRAENQSATTTSSQQNQRKSSSARDVGACDCEK